MLRHAQAAALGELYFVDYQKAAGDDNIFGEFYTNRLMSGIQLTNLAQRPKWLGDGFKGIDPATPPQNFLPDGYRGRLYQFVYCQGYS